MLETHRIDVLIVEAIAGTRNGATVDEIGRHIANVHTDALTRSAIERHLPGLRALGTLQRRTVTRQGRRVNVWSTTDNEASK
jgi:predicted transcriptional regulator